MGLRIGLVTGEFPPMQGGVGAFSNELARNLTILGHEVHVITHRAARDPTRDGLRRTLTSPRDPLQIDHATVHARGGRWGWGDVGMLADVVLRRNLDVVNIQYQAAAYNMHVPAINLAPWRLRGLSTVVVTFHDLRVPYLLPKAGPLRSYVVRLLARSAHGVIATNREDYVTLRSWDIADDRLQQIPIGSNIARRTFDEEELTRLREKLGIAPGSCLVGYFGFLSESKGADTLLRAIAANGPQVHLLFIGGRAGDSARSSDERFAGQLDALIDELGVGDRVHRTGYVDAEEVSAYLQTCEVIVLPYRDGVSFRRGTLMAALTHGKAIVSTEPPIDEPLLQHGRNIWLVARESDKALGTAVGDLCANADLRQQLEDGASELAQRFDWSGIAAATAEFFFALRRAQRA